MPYFEAMVAPVAAGRKDDYQAFCTTSSKVFLDYGALQTIDLYGDAEVPEGKQTDFWRAVAADRPGGEAIALGWIVWPDKAARDSGWERIMADGAMKPGDHVPFDGKRMIFGGFELLHDSKAA